MKTKNNQEPGRHEIMDQEMADFEKKKTEKQERKKNQPNK